MSELLENQSNFKPDLIFDGGESGCGELLLEMRLALRKVPANGVMAVITVDPGAPEDLPAWCRMTGHTLLGREPLDRRRTAYFIQKTGL